MNFKHDLLLVDLETTGLDVTKHEIIQIGAVLLDKKTLKEKKALASFVRPAKWKNRDRESMEVNGIKWEQVKKAPGLKTFLNQINKSFNPKSVILSYYGGPLDMDFLRVAYRRVGLKWQFDYHYLNLWGVFYAFLAARGQLKNRKKFTGFSLEDLINRFKISDLGLRHDALGDCRIEAEVLRRILG